MIVISYNDSDNDSVTSIAEELVTTLKILATCLSVSNRLCRILVLLVLVIFDDILKVDPAGIFNADFNLSKCKFGNLMFIFLH